MAARERFIAADGDCAIRVLVARESEESNHASKRWQMQAFCKQSAMATVAVAFAVIDAWQAVTGSRDWTQ
jgi:hypothetical protein